MSLYNLDKMLNPSSVAIVGASERVGSIGRALLENLIVGGYEGALYPVNPKREEVLGVKAYPSLEAVGRPVDLVLVATPITTAPDLIGQCADLGCQGAVILSAGGKEAGREGLIMESRIRGQAYEAHVRVVGPNCLGIISSKSKLNASFAHMMPAPGKMAFVSQSGAICTAVLDFAITENIGFSYVVSIGSMLDVDFGDLIDYLGNDPEVSSILLYVENITNTRKFMSAARSVSRVKPIVALKVGRNEAGARAARSHTGAMAGEDIVYDSAFKRAGIVRVDSLEDLFGCAELIGKQRLPQGPRLAIITNAGGPGVMSADYLASYGVDPAPLSPETMARMDDILPEFWSRSNPVDILGDAPPELFRKAVDICLSSGDFDAALITTAVQAMNHPTDLAKALIPTLKLRKLPIFTVWLGGREVAAGRELFTRHGIPTYDSLERAIRSFIYMHRYHGNLELLRQIPPKMPQTLEFDTGRARQIVRDHLDHDERLLSEAASKELLGAYGIPVTPTRVAATVEDAIETALDLGFPVALKLHSPDITHKTDVGGVKLDLRTPGEVKRAFEGIMKAAADHDPIARLWGVTVQPMVRHRDFELILGLKKDPDWGPAILFGLGGTTAEVFLDRSVGLPPLDRLLARRLMEGAKVYQLLKGYRNIPPANLDLLEEILVRLSQLSIDFPEIAELDINPLFVGGGLAVAADARVVVEPYQGQPQGHLSISPYPNELDFGLVAKSGLKLHIRPIKPEDAPLMAELWETFSSRTVEDRYLQPLPGLSSELLARSTQVDYDRELALVALSEENGRERIVGVARLMRHPDGHEAELGMSVGDPWQGKGIAGALLETALPIVQESGVQRVWVRIRSGNRAARTLAERFGADIRPLEDGDRLEVTFTW